MNLYFNLKEALASQNGVACAGNERGTIILTRFWLGPTFGFLSIEKVGDKITKNDKIY